MKKQRLKGKHKTRTIISVTAAVMLLLPKGYLVKGETYEYDALNRIQKVYYDDGSVAEYFYDASGNIQNVRTETTQSQPEESTKTEETTKEEETTGHFAHGEIYEYDALNRIQKVYYDDGSVVCYSYDASGNIQNVRIETAQSQPEESKKTEESTETEETTKIEQTKEIEETEGAEEMAQEALALGYTVEGEEQKNLNKTKEKNIFQKIGEWFENIFHSLKEISSAVH